MRTWNPILAVCGFKGGAWQERGGGVVDTPMHTMFIYIFIFIPPKGSYWEISKFFI